MRETWGERLLRIGLFAVLIAILLRILSLGWEPRDDAQRHGAKAVAQRPWRDNPVLRPGESAVGAAFLVVSENVRDRWGPPGSDVALLARPPLRWALPDPGGALHPGTQEVFFDLFPRWPQAPDGSNGRV